MEVMSAGTVGNILMSGGSGIPQWVSTSSFIVDSDFASNGLMVRTGSGIYTSTSTLSLGSGGTGNNNWADLSIPYVSGSAMAGIAIGTPDYVLAVNGSGTGYTWVSASSTGAWRDDESIMDVAGGLIASTSGTRTLITITYQDGTDDIDFVVNSDLSQYNNSTSQFYSTTTGMILPLAYGGTGTSTFQANSLLFASANNVISEILAGSNGKVLKMIGGIPGWGDDLTSSGGSGAAAGWATSTDNIYIYTTNNSLAQPYVVVVGGSSTTTTGYQFEVSGNSLFDGITADSLSLSTDLAITEGGTGRSSWTQYGIVYADTTTSLSHIAIGTPDYVLAVNGSGTGYTWVSASSTGAWRDDESIMDVAGPLVASGTSNSLISVFYNDAADSVDFTVNSDLSQYNNSTSQFYSTTTGMILPLAYGGTNKNMTAAAGGVVYTDADSMEVMSAGTVGNILMSGGSGIPQWVSTSSFIVDGDFASNGLMVRTGSGIYTSTSTLSLGSGGTGNNNWADLSIPYVSGSAMAGIAIGTPDYVLAVNGSGTGYTWVSASSTGAWRDDESIMDVAGGLIASTSGTRTLITITYQDGTDDIDFVVNSDLSQYNNSTSQFYSTTTGMILPLAYGGTNKNLTVQNGGGVWTDADSMEVTGAGSIGNILMSQGAGAPVWVSTSTYVMDNDFTENGLMVRTGSGAYTSTSSLALDFGGTGRSSWNNLDIPYISNGAMAGIAIGTPDYVLAVNGSGTGYTWVSASSTGAWRDDESIMDVAGGLIASTSGTRTLITITYQDGTDDIDFVVNSDLSQYNNSTSQFYSTTTGMILPLAYGGTGTSTFQANSLLFASDNNVISEILAGNDGLVLKMVGGTPAWSSDLTSGGGEGLWSTSTNNLAIYPSTNRAVVVGGTGTTTSGYLFEVTSGNALFDGITAESLTLTNALGVMYGGLGANITTTGVGALLYSTSASTYGALATGTVGNILMSGGSGIPQWVSTSSFIRS